MNIALVEIVKLHALKNYEKAYGWSEVTECYSTADIWGIIKSASSPEDAIRLMSEVVDMRSERYRDAVGPDVRCGSCGRYFPENTCCPHCDR